MRTRTSFGLAASGLALSAFLVAVPSIAQERVGAGGLPTTESTPAEKAETRSLNNQIQADNQAVDAQAAQQQADHQAAVAATNAQAAANDAQFQAQQQQYQGQLQQNQVALQQNKAQQQDYQDRTAAYNSLQVRYAAERAAYHRGVWPSRYVKWVIVERDAGLIGERVQLITGSRVGTVIDTAHIANGNVSALLVQLDSDKIVWIDVGDVRYNRADGIIMTNLDRADLRHMADQRV